MEKPCKTCPFLEANRGKPTPTDFKCVDQNLTDWYSQDNIDGIWRVTRQVSEAYLSCHSTDTDYYGKNDEKVYACVGLTLLVYMHIKVFDLAGNYPEYVKLVGPNVAMPYRSLIHKAHCMAHGKTDPEWADMILVQKINVDLKDIRWPTGFEKTIREFNATEFI